MDCLTASMKACAAGVIRPGEVSHVEVKHDRDCPALKRRVCRCKPDFRLIRSGELIRIENDGTIEQETREP